MADYRAPPLNRRVTVRNPSSQTATRDRYGRAVTSDHAEQWELWAHRRDRQPNESIEEGVLVHESTVEFTIRHRAGLDADVEVVDGGTVFRAIGPALERGRRGNGASHLVIVAEVRE